MHEIKQTPGTEQNLIHIRGDIIKFQLSVHPDEKGVARLRTNIEHAEIRRNELIDYQEKNTPVLARDWTDIPMTRIGDGAYEITLPLTRTGRFEAKAFFLRQGSTKPLWPEGNNTIIKVEPWQYAEANSIYTAFVRQFGANRFKSHEPRKHEATLAGLEKAGYTVIPRSGTFRDLRDQLDFIIKKLGFRIIQLLPIHPCPTTYARMGRFGSPYAALDFMNVDPALAEFDKTTTPLEQFQELVDTAHRLGGKIFLDIPVNHTGWGSRLQIDHPEWFVRNPDNTFQSPGAWGVTWEDLAKLDYSRRGLWQYMAQVFLFWCARGVDGFRCDAGYMIPFEVWEYIVAKVRREFPDTIFLLEGLGGKIEVMKNLLDKANLDWAYSELFQNYDKNQVGHYLSEWMPISSTKGNLVHYAETHDNNRMASISREYSKMRTALSALFSMNGAFGITAGVEWFADEKIDVHEAPSLNWDNQNNQVELIARLNTILKTHPTFRHGSEITMIHSGQGSGIALKRVSPCGKSSLIAMINLNTDTPTRVYWRKNSHPFKSGQLYNLLTEQKETIQEEGDNFYCDLAGGGFSCLSDQPLNIEQNADTLINRAFKCKILEILCFFQSAEKIPQNIDNMINSLADNPIGFCKQSADGKFAHIVSWQWPRDTRRKVILTPKSFLAIKCPHGFTAELLEKETVIAREESLPDKNNAHFALFLPLPREPRVRELTLKMTVHTPEKTVHSSTPLLLLSKPGKTAVKTSFTSAEVIQSGIYGLCANNRGAMTQANAAWGLIRSQYDAILAANLNPDHPVDRQVMFTRCRAWVVYMGYSHEINLDSLTRFSTVNDNRLQWRFEAPCGMGKTVQIIITLKMKQEENAVSMTFHRAHNGEHSNNLPKKEPVTIILRPDIEDRNFHCKTKAFTGPETQWPAAINSFHNGFEFSPTKSHSLKMTVSQGAFTHEPEWLYMVSHPVDAERGLDGASDLFSPGWFSFELEGDSSAMLEAEVLRSGETTSKAKHSPEGILTEKNIPIEQAMVAAIKAFIVKRDTSKTVIAGYPWFLDWGRDTLICLRGITAAGMIEESADIIGQFARYESQGTIPNMIRGNDTSNRDTSDAPLWLFVACSDIVKAGIKDFTKQKHGGRTIGEILLSIANWYIKGTPNGIKMDKASGLIFSPSHFTWMDTNHPAGTPREGYPVEIQALWHAALAFLSEFDTTGPWRELAGQVKHSIENLFVINALEKARHCKLPAPPYHSYLSDCLHAAPGVPAEKAARGDALRSNQLFAITLDCIGNNMLRESILCSCEELLVPGGIRSLADQPVQHQLPVFRDNNLINDPANPYWGEYKGDEDTRRKPAYHNGTAWTWPFPSYCEAMFKIWGKPAREPALSILSSSLELINSGCAGHLPEIMDGNIPHTQKGCGAQAWGITELYRVWKLITTPAS